MSYIVKLVSRRWRALVRRKQKSVSKTFRIKSDADRWASEQEDRLNRGVGINTCLHGDSDTLGNIIELHLTDMAEVGKAAQRSKEATLLRLQDTIGSIEDRQK